MLYSVKTQAELWLCSENLNETELKNNVLSCLMKEISQ